MQGYSRLNLREIPGHGTGVSHISEAFHCHYSFAGDGVCAKFLLDTLVKLHNDCCGNSEGESEGVQVVYNESEVHQLKQTTVTTEVMKDFTSVMKFGKIVVLFGVVTPPPGVGFFSLNSKHSTCSYSLYPGVGLYPIPSLPGARTLPS